MPSARCSPVPLSPICAPGDQRRAVVEAGGGGGAAGALRDVLVDLAVLVRARAEALDRGDDHLRIELLDALPGEAHAVERARGEVLDQHVAVLDQPLEHRLAARILVSSVIERLLWFSMVKYRLSTSGMSRSCSRVTSPAPGPLDLDDVGAEPRQQLRAGRTGLHVREVEDANAVQCLAHASVSGCFLLVHGLVLGAGRVFARVDPDVDHRGACAGAAPTRARAAAPGRSAPDRAPPRRSRRASRRTCRTARRPSRLPTLPRSSPYLASWP